jgi:molybdenum cofactor cytidylyltransferase
MSSADLHVIVLAAGASTRFGSPKQLAQVAGGTMLQVALSRAQGLADHAVTVVLGAHAAEIAPALGRSNVSLVVNRNWEEGMAASIRAGIAALPGHCGGALLMLADQCAVTTDDLRRLAETWRRNPQAIVAAQYAGGYGVPAIFPRASFPALQALYGERGAQALLRDPVGARVGVPMPSAAIDIDTTQELRALNAAAADPPDLGEPVR